MSFLLDTNVISEIRRGRDPHVRAWSDHVNDLDLYLSALTLGEVRKGIEGLRPRDPARADIFDAWLDHLHRWFDARILPIDATVAEDWGRLNAVQTRSTVDSLIAATARVHQLTVVTRNTSDFDGYGVSLLNPWHHDPTQTDP